MTVRLQWHYRAGLILAAVIIVAQALGQPFLSEVGERVDFNSLTTLVCVLLATAGAAYAAILVRRYRPRLFPAWLMIAVGQTLLIAGAVADVIQASLVGQVSYPTAGDAFYLTAYPLFLLFAFLLPADASSGLEKLRWAFDGAIVALSTSLLFWYFIIGPTLQTYPGTRLQLWVVAAYSVGNLVMLWSLMTLMLRRFPLQPRAPLWWLIVAIAAQIFYDLFNSLFGRTLHLVARSTPLEMLITTTQLSMMLACLLQAQKVSAPAAAEAGRLAPEGSLPGQVPPRRPFRLFRLVTPYLWLAAAFLVLPVGQAFGWAVNPIVAIWWVALIVSLVVVRQVVVMRDNQRLDEQLYRLNASLEEQVAARSAQLRAANDELSLVNRQLRENAAQLHSALEEVRRLNTDLEQRVDQRTAELRLAKEAAEAANRAKSAFLAIMGHELRTPLNGIFLAAEMLRDHDVVRADHGNFPEIILASGRRLLKMVEGVMEYTAADIHLELAPLDVGEALREVAVRFEPKAARKGIALDFDIQAGLPPVPADLRRFDQILGRLLDNAVRFTPENGRIVVTAQALPSWPFTTGERPALRVTVTDNGPGIRPEDCERIFEPFVQLEDSYLLHSEGAGLGLTLARRLAVAHGGAVTAECRGVGNGSTLTLLLPLSRQTELA